MIGSISVPKDFKIIGIIFFLIITNWPFIRYTVVRHGENDWLVTFNYNLLFEAFLSLRKNYWFKRHLY